MAQHLYNTLSGKKEPLATLEPGRLGIYVCGPTVYDLSHVGHARVYVAFDTIVRYLRRRYAVTFVRNYTDVDDKIIKRAAELGEPAAKVAGRNIAAFIEDMTRLGVARADIEPQVTAHIPEIIAIIETLVAKEHAYVVGGERGGGADIYFAVGSFAAYGRLGRRNLDDLEAGARVEVNQRKRNPMDFALWKGEVPAEGVVWWDSPWGPGRPGWHIECSAMSRKYLGESFDLHCGGKDLIFPHHENEIAQSEAASGRQMSRYWLHNGFVNIDNEKMSKSLGNFFTIREVLAKFDPQTLRYYLLTTHYRSPINFSDVSLEQAEGRVKYVYETLARLTEVLAAAAEGPVEPPYRDEAVAAIIGRFETAMDDDFNTAKVIGDVSDIFKLVNEIIDKPGDPDTDLRTLRAVRGALGEVGEVLGLFVEEPGVVLARMERRRESAAGVDPERVETLIAERVTARQTKDFARADAIRGELEKMGVLIKDTPQGTTWEVG